MGKRRRPKTRKPDNVIRSAGGRVTTPRSKAFRKMTLPPGAPSATPLRQRYKAILTSELEDMYRERAANELPRIDLSAVGLNDGAVVAAADAWPLLEGLHDAFVDVSRRNAEWRGSAEWLWFLRRVTGQFDINEFETTDPYVQAVIEAVTAGTSRVSRASDDTHSFVFYPDEHMLLDAMLLRHHAIGLYRLHATMKRCAKGQDVQFFESKIPEAVVDEVLEIAILEYDLRVQRSGQRSELTSVGLHLPEPDPEADDFDGYGGRIPTWNHTNDRSRGFRTADPSPCVVSWLDLADVRPFRTVPVLTTEQVALAAVLHASFNIMTREPEHFRRRSQAAWQWGYIATPTKEFLRPALSEALEWMTDHRSTVIPAESLPANVDDLLSVLASIEPSYKPPLAGNPLHPTGSHTLVDLLGASRRLRETLERPTDGAGVNEFTAEFEAQVQLLIDSTSWRPTGSLRELVGRKLKRADGSLLTDVDAVAANGNTLVLVSCKSSALSPALARHEYNALREFREKIEQAATTWRRVLSAIHEAPHVLPVEEAQSMDVHGVVVYPIVPYVVDEGLRRPGPPFDRQPVLSIEELRDALAARKHEG